VKRVGFVLRRGKPEAERICGELVAVLGARGLEAVILPEHDGLGLRAAVVPEEEFPQRVDLLVVLGGDGTLLHGGGIVAQHGVPILGINLGRLGFLTPFATHEAEAALVRALDGGLAIEQRVRLRVRLLRSSGEVVERYAINDAVLSQGGIARLIDLLATLDGAKISQYRADGLIVSTPTGSTAYNLAAGGPILAPGLSSMCITPICPHMLNNRPLVVPSQSRVELVLAGDTRGVVLTVDGQWAHPVEPGDRVEISEAAVPLRLYRSEKSYFEILRDKLSWGERADAQAP
jgi:NAD+ kinase